MAEQNRNRVKFLKGQQKIFIDSIKKRLNLDCNKVAKAFDINRRTLNDWHREKSTMSYSALLNLSRNYNISIPRKIRILSPFWYTKKAAKLGARARNRLYGNPGTPEGRRKGGLVTMRKFMANPLLAKKLGVSIKKDIKSPQRGLKLAEFIGIVLGDGGITDYQVKITFNRDTDAAYADFMQEVIKRLFKLMPKIISKKSDKGDNIVIYSKSLVEFLESNGLRRGNKVKNKADIPSWILDKNEFAIACLRGLMDTDGSCYAYANNINKKRYHHVALCFTNASEPLLKSVYTILDRNGYHPSMSGRRVYIYGKNEVAEYFQKVGTHNSKHLQKYQKFIQRKNIAG